MIERHSTVKVEKHVPQEARVLFKVSSTEKGRVYSLALLLEGIDIEGRRMVADCDAVGFLELSVKK